MAGAVEIVASIVAADRPGLVKRLAEAIAGEEGNWVDSSMARLGGSFAGIVRVSVPEARAAGLEAALSALAKDGITVLTRRSEGAAPVGARAALDLTCADRPGIVRTISERLAARGVSIDELETEVFTGSMSGEALFKASARIVIPPETDAAEIARELETIGMDMMAEIRLRTD